MPRADESRGDHGAGKALSVGGDDVGGTRRHFTHRREAAQQLVERVEVFVDERGHRRQLAAGISSPAAW